MLTSKGSTMAQKVSIELVDDLDGSPAAETVVFAIDGVTYEIDLSAENAGGLRKALAGYIGVARRAGGRRPAGSGRRRSPRGGTEASNIRAWARANGHKVSERGRVGADVVAAYNAR